MDKIEQEEIIYLIAGRVNAMGRTLYWKNETQIKDMAIGNYVIVENNGGYDLAEILGIVGTTKENASSISNVKYENMKKVIREITI